MVLIAFLEELSDYKQKITESLCNSRPVIDMLLDTPHFELPKPDLVYDSIYPYPYVPETAQKRKVFICYETSVSKVMSPVCKEIELTIYVIVHKELMKFPGGVRTDLLSNEIDKILNGDKNYGFGTVSLISSVPFFPATNFYGRKSTYSVKDFNRRFCDCEQEHQCH